MLAADRKLEDVADLVGQLEIDQQFGAARLVGSRCGAIVGPFAVIICPRDEADALAHISEGRSALPLRNEALEFEQPLAVRSAHRRRLDDIDLGIIAVDDRKSTRLYPRH